MRAGATMPSLWKTSFILSREDFPEMPPLNTEDGQKFIDTVIGLIGGIELVIFDNVQALLPGDMKEEAANAAVDPRSDAPENRPDLDSSHLPDPSHPIEFKPPVISVKGSGLRRTELH
jgi:hypothetical protein